MIHHLIHGSVTALLHLEGMDSRDQTELLSAFRSELLDRPEERWVRPWGGGGSMDPAFVGWPRIIVEVDSELLLADNKSIPQLERRYGFETHHCWRTDDDRYVLIVKPRPYHQFRFY